MEPDGPTPVHAEGLRLELRPEPWAAVSAQALESSALLCGWRVRTAAFASLQSLEPWLVAVRPGGNGPFPSDRAKRYQPSPRPDLGYGEYC